jgi:hypothetical protein
MNAVKKPSDQPDPHEKARHLFGADALKTYAYNVEELRRAAETHATLAWRDNWRERAAKYGKVLSGKAGECITLFEGVQRGHSDENVEKAIKDATKAITEAREEREAFIKCAVGKHTALVQACERLRDDAMATARQAESTAPIQFPDAIERMNAFLSTLPIVSWDEDQGRVFVS